MSSVLSGAPLAPSSSSSLRPMLAALSASLVGIGLARFAYTPLLPAIIAAHWFAASQAGYLAAANLMGYLIGALVAVPLAARMPARTVLRGMMAATAASLLACAWPLSFAWFCAWRIVSGIGGGALMVLAAPAVLPAIPAERRGAASGLIFMGVGLGVAASGTLVPLLLQWGLTQTWLALGLISLALTALAWTAWPASSAVATTAPAPVAAAAPQRVPGLARVYAAYALNAAGLVPHMVFLVDYVARGLGEGLAAASRYWIAYGLAAIAGPVLAGRLADRIGFRAALRVAHVLQAAAVGMTALGLFGAAGLLVSSIVCGAFTPGIVPLVLGRVRELLADRPALQHAAWSRATTAFALLQALAAYGMAWLLGASGGRYALLFALAAAAIVAALALDLRGEASSS
ncbi:YbfB/YjiJ family MFS transporter [Pelomonas sp. KK5]|uniref:YbfB/YjiJ family MFS transporter n=1 Tax=Pelomonas sp. KK5 TaxID=1855730 RepID=UPI00097C23A2|nr:YbfB/YjiJ family MFS transporter [Pelomonas sp. KK5]